MQFINFISERLKHFFSGRPVPPSEEADSESFHHKEKIIAFSIAFFIALCLWFIVNLSRDFNITIQVPVLLTNLSDDVTLSSEVPQTASVSLNGEGWKLISVYSNPPRIMVNAEVSDVNLAEQVRNQIGAFSDLNIVRVEPARITIETERKAEKRVPLRNLVNITVRDQFGLLREPVITPDSVTVTGAENTIRQLTEWFTEETELRNISGSIERTVNVAQVPGIIVEPQTVMLSAEVTEFTEAEIRVPIRTRNLPNDSAVSYNPSTITVRFDVPIHQYSEIRGTRPFAAYVDFSVIEEDNTGRVTPEIEILETDYLLKLRSFQPQRVSYFRIVAD
jgi:YbbR domain-containing protein